MRGLGSLFNSIESILSISPARSYLPMSQTLTELCQVEKTGEISFVMTTQPTYLESLQMSELVEKFEEEEIDLNYLLSLSEENFRELKIEMKLSLKK